MATQRKINLRFPVKGLHRRFGFQDQPPFSTTDALNVRSDDQLLDSEDENGKLIGRARGGMRPGLKRELDGMVFGGTEFQGRPIRMISSVRVVPSDRLTSGKTVTFLEAFPKQKYSKKGWKKTVGSGQMGRRTQSLPDIVPNPDQENDFLAKTFFDKDKLVREAALYTKLLPMDTRRVYIMEADLNVEFLEERKFGVAGFEFYVRTRDTKGYKGAMTVIALSFHDADELARVTIWEYLDGDVVDSVSNAHEPAGREKKGKIRITVEPRSNGRALITMYWNGIEIIEGGYLTKEGVSAKERMFGFGMISGRLNQGPYSTNMTVDNIRVRYTLLDEDPPVPDLTIRDSLIVSAGGLFYADQSDGTFDNISIKDPNVFLKSDRRVAAAHYLQRSFIADTGVKLNANNVELQGAFGRIRGNALTQKDMIFGLAREVDVRGVNPEGDVLVLTAHPFLPDDAEKRYRIAAVSQHALMIEGTVEGGDVIDPWYIVWRVERAPKYYNAQTRTLSMWESENPNTGKVKGIIPLGCSIIMSFTGRIFLAGDPRLANVVFASRRGDPFDWDIRFDPEDLNAAWATDSGGADIIGEPVTALIPHTDDYAFFGAVNSMWVMRGDLAFGGSLDNSTRNIGIVDKGAWCSTPTGELVFLSRDGLYAYAAGMVTSPQPLSRDVLPQELTHLDTSRTEVLLAYDVRDRLIHIYLTSRDGKRESEHFSYNWQTKAFWKVKFGENFLDPGALYYHSPIDSSVGSVLLGCRDGIVRAFDPGKHYDEGDGRAVKDQHIEDFVLYGPLSIGGESQLNGWVQQLTATLAATSGPVRWELYVADSPEEAVNSSRNGDEPFASGDWTSGVNYINRPMALGQSAVLRVSAIKADEPEDDEGWAIENVPMTVRRAGRFLPV